MPVGNVMMEASVTLLMSMSVDIGRALSSYGLLQGLTGVRYDAVDKTLYINSKIGDFISFISTESGFGNVELRSGKPFVKVVSGHIEVDRFVVSGKVVE